MARFIVVLLLVVPLSRKVDACSCGEARSLAVDFEDASAVFTGEVVRLEIPDMLWKARETPPPSRLIEGQVSQHPHRLVEVTLQVHKVWKGVDANTVTLFTTVDCCMCGRRFEIGTTYVVFAAKTNGRLETTSCMRGGALGSEGDVSGQLGIPILDFFTPLRNRAAGLPEDAVVKPR